MEKLCSICRNITDSDTAPILVMGGYGNPKYVCEACAADIDVATTSREPEEVAAAIEKLGRKLSIGNNDDPQVLECINEIFKSASERAAQIKDGSYDFSAEEQETSEEEDPSEELVEGEEEEPVDEKKIQQMRRLEIISNWFFGVVFFAALAFFAYKMFF